MNGRLASKGLPQDINPVTFPKVSINVVRLQGNFLMNGLFRQDILQYPLILKIANKQRYQNRDIKI